MHNMKYKLIAVATSFASAVPVFAEGTGTGINATTLGDALKTYITDASGVVVTLLTAGAVIVGSFYIWRVLKRALMAAK